MIMISCPDLMILPRVTLLAHDLGFHVLRIYSATILFCRSPNEELLFLFLFSFPFFHAGIFFLLDFVFGDVSKVKVKNTRPEYIRPLPKID